MNTRPIIQGNDQLVETELYKWLKDRHSKGIEDTHFAPTVIEYTGVKEAPFKGRNDLTAHRYVFDCFWDSILKPKTN